MHTKRRLAQAVLTAIIFLCCNPVAAQFPQNLDIVILIDVSGSMRFSLDGCNWRPGNPDSPGDPPHPDDPTGATCPDAPTWERHYYLKEALQALPPALDKLKTPVSEGGLGVVEAIQFAVGVFSGSVTNGITWLDDVDPADAGYNPNLRAFNSQTELQSILDNKITAPSGGTPIGNAIQQPNGAIQMFNAYGYAGAETFARIALLFTDGKRYGGLEIYENEDSDPLHDRDEDHVIFKTAIDQMTNNRPNAIKIVSIGFGNLDNTDSETDFEMLEDISKHFDKYDPSGIAPDVLTKNVLEDFFDLPDISYGTISLDDPGFFISPGETQEHDVYVTQYDSALIFSVSWNDPRVENTIRLTLRTDAGTLIDPAFARRNAFVQYDAGTTFQMYTVHRQYLENNTGTWQLVVNGQNIERAEWYAYSILGNSKLQLLNVTEPTDRPKHTGDSLRLKVRLQADDALFANAEVKAKISGPGVGAGNWFAGFPLSPAQLDSVKSIEFPTVVDDVYKKFYYMRQVRGIASPISASFEIPMTYQPDGGYYAGTTPALTVAGIYRAEVVAVYDSTQAEGPFRRTLRDHFLVQVRPNLDWTYSNLEFQKAKDIEGFEIYVMTFTPKDRFGNFVRPGKENRVRFHAKNAVVSERTPIDDLEGSYRQTVRVPKSSLRPKVQVQFGPYLFDERDITDDPSADSWRIHPNGLSLHFGMAVPTGTTSNSYEPDLHFSVDVNRYLLKNWAFVIHAGYSRFKGKGAQNDLTYWHAVATVRWLPIVTPFYRTFLSMGTGFYDPDFGPRENGVVMGAGVAFPVSSHFDLEFGADANIVDRSNSTFRFLRIYGSLVYRF